MGLGQQDIHVARQASGDRVDAEPHVHAVGTQPGQLKDRVLEIDDSVAGIFGKRYSKKQKIRFPLYPELGAEKGVKMYLDEGKRLENLAVTSI